MNRFFLCVCLLTIPSAANAQASADNEASTDNQVFLGAAVRPARILQSPEFEKIVDAAKADEPLQDMLSNLEERFGVPPANIDRMLILFDRNSIFESVNMQPPSPGNSAPAKPKMASLTTRRNQLKQIGLGLHNFHDVYGTFPNVDGAPKDANRGNLSWRVHLLPFVEQANLYHQFHLDERWDSPHNKTLIEKMPDIFSVSSNDKPGHTRIRLIQKKDNPKGAFGEDQASRFRHIIDGTSNTLMAATAGSDKTEIWTKPTALPYQPGAPENTLGKIDDTFLVLLCDGSVRSFSRDLDEATFLSIVTRDGREVIDRDAFYTGGHSQTPGPPEPVFVIQTLSLIHI